MASLDTASRARRVGTVAVLVLLVLSIAVPAATGWSVHSLQFPPLNASWHPRIGPGTPAVLLIAGLASWQATTLAERLPWRRLLLVGYVVGLAWLVSLALVDGRAGIGAVLEGKNEYLRTATRVTSVTATLDEFVSRIPLAAAPHNWPVHVAGHPPGALLFFVLLVHLGLGSGLAAGFVVTAIAATTAPAVLITMRVLGAEAAARRAAPFLVLGPAALWQAVSADAMFAAVAAWGMAALALATRHRHLAVVAGWAAVAGLLLGYCVMLSYGLPVLGVLALTVLWLGRSWRPLPVAAGAAVAVVLSFDALGFAWWQALPVLQHRYWTGIARVRPAAYWVWADLAALTFSAGPIWGASAASAVIGSRRPPAEDRVPVLLTLAGLAMVLLADGSLMSKAETERIWLPFVPWLLTGCALLPLRWRRLGMVAQLTTALVVQHLLATPW